MPEIIARTSSKDYSIRIQSGLLEQTGQILAAMTAGRRAMVITDETVAGLYLGRVLQSLRGAGFQTFSFAMEDGEENKNLSTLERIYHAFGAAGITRRDIVIALGGGVVGDIASFAAATFLRGIRLIHIPTTLMAQVDSSIGGYTGINLKFGKDLVGTSYHPHAVLIDPLTLSTLSRERLADGMAEVIKYGAAMDPQLFDRIESKRVEFEWIVDRCARLKAGVVRRDEYDKGERQLLNFGHTLGQAIERLTDYNVYYHGEAVSIGMALSARIGELLGLTEPGTEARLRKALVSWQLPVDGPPFSAEAILTAVRTARDLPGDKINFIVLKSIGEAVVHPMTIEELDVAFHKIWK